MRLFPVNFTAFESRSWEKNARRVVVLSRKKSHERFQQVKCVAFGSLVCPWYTHNNDAEVYDDLMLILWLEKKKKTEREYLFCVLLQRKHGSFFFFLSSHLYCLASPGSIPNHDSVSSNEVSNAVKLKANLIV